MKWNFIPLVAGVFGCGIAAISAGPVFDVRNSEGRALRIELLEFNDGTAVFTVAGDNSGKQHSLSLDRSDSASQEKIKEEAKSLPARVPELRSEVVVSRKREKAGYYMVNEDVSARVKVRNMSTRIALGKSKAVLTYFGRDRRNGDNYKIMGRKDFELELTPNEQTEEMVAGFRTSYDSDNRGYGNVGGFQYDCYLLIIMDDAGNIHHTLTSDAGVRAQIEKDRTKAKRLTEANVGQTLGKGLEIFK